MPVHFSADRAAALEVAVRFGMMSEAHYRTIANALLGSAPCTLLVFGAGFDAALWTACVEKIAFVEDNPAFLTVVPPKAPVQRYSFRSRVGTWCDVPPPPWSIRYNWDYVLIDGPGGFNKTCPGRQFPIAWARHLARRKIFVHDYERPWERALCDKLLGTPIEVLTSTPSRPGELAVFDLFTSH
jgi:hypothetical protein